MLLKQVTLGVAPRRNAAWHRSTCARVVASPVQQADASPQAYDEGADLRLMAELAEEEMGLVACKATRLGRGLVADSDLQRQVLVSIPVRHALVVSDDPLNNISVFGDRAQREWQETHGDLPPDLLDFIKGDQRWDVRLTAWLLFLLDTEGTIKSKSPAWARDAPASLWDLYLHQLPDERDMSCLLNYTKEEAVELQIKRLVDEAAIQHEWVVHLHDRWFSKKGRGPKALQLAHSLKETLWASAMVRSRTFSEEINGEGLTLMVPFADLANHSVDWNATFNLSKDRQSFELRSTEPLSAGSEALISYGDNKSNPELFRDYGFVIPGNPWDRIPLLPGDDLLLTDSLSAAGPRGGTADVPCLNGASLCEAADMQGDWMRGELEAMEDSVDLLEDEADWERRRCALLSFPLSDGYQGYGGACSTRAGRQQQEGEGGGMFGWAKPFTDASAPRPRKLKVSEVRDERTNIARYHKQLSSLLAALPTSVDTDMQLLRDAARGGKMSVRHTAAIRCRLEHKRVIGHGLAMLDVYDEALAESVNLPGSR